MQVPGLHASSSCLSAGLAGTKGKQCLSQEGQAGGYGAGRAGSGVLKSVPIPADIQRGLPAQGLVYPVVGDGRPGHRGVTWAAVYPPPLGSLCHPGAGLSEVWGPQHLIPCFSPVSLQGKAFCLCFWL